MKRIGEKLQLLRQQHNLTTRQLSEQLEISHVQVSRIETGSRKPSADLILKIALFFDVSIDKLMRDDYEL